jgi:hypothetical protein
LTQGSANESISDDGGAGQTLEVPSPTTGLENIRYVVPCSGGGCSNMDPSDLAGPDTLLEVPMMATEKGLQSRAAHNAKEKLVRWLAKQVGMESNEGRDVLHHMLSEAPKDAKARTF